MKRCNWAKIGVCIIFSLLIASNSFAGQHWWKPGLPDIPDGWSEIDPEVVYPEFDYNGLTPACSNCPICEFDDKFTFFVKKGTVNKLVIYFQGGGACWDSMNCLYFPTYTQKQTETLDMFTDTEGMGILDTANPANPFKDWFFVYIPYCTGDIHLGARDTSYIDYLDGIPYVDSWTIQHRGFVNFQVVLQWIEDNFEWPHKIFVTGISAGSYGAIGGFPYIKEAFPWSRVYILGDSAIGVTSEAFRTGGIYNWNIQLPDWIPGYEGGYTPEMTTADWYIDYANHYPLSKVAQSTTAWDATQATFYNMMLNIHDPGEWENIIPVWCAWHTQALDFLHDTAASVSNYRHYIAAGIYHTILMSPEFYTEDSAGIPFVEWVRAMVRNPFGMWGGPFKGWWRNVECEDCGDPLPCVP